MGSKKHVLKGTFQPQNNLKPEGGFMGRFRDVGHSVARFLPKFKDDSDDMGAENAPEVNSTQKPHRSGLVSQKATSSRPGDKRRQSPEIDELAEDEKHHAKRQRRSNDLKTPPRVDIAALESRRTVAIAKRDVEEVQRITDQLEGNRLSSRTYQQSSKQPPEAIDSDDELNASPTKELDASGSSRPSLNGQVSPSNRKTPKGDIHKTKFKERQESQDEEVTLSRAVSGRVRFDAKQCGQTIRLRLNKKDTFSLVPVNKAGEKLAMQWLTLTLRDCHKIKFSKESQHLVFFRSSTSITSPKLCIEIPSISDVIAIIRWIFSAIATGAQDLKFVKLEQPPRETLQKVFENLYQSAPEQDRRRGLDPRLCRQGRGSSPASPETAETTRRISLRDRMKVASNSPPDVDKSQLRRRSPRSNQLERRTSDDMETLSAMNFFNNQWIKNYPDWDKIWEDKPLIYPASGKNRAQIIKDDIFRLEEHQCLNDNLIVFYLRYLQDQLETENAGWSERILFMNPWFYERLGQQKGRGVDYDAVKSWTAKIDLLSKDYIIVPVNEAAHWYLAIICHPGKLLPATVTDDKKTTVTNVDEEDMPQPESPIQSTSDPAVDVQDDSETDVRIVSDIASGKSPKLFKEITSGKEQTRKLDGGGKRPAEPGDARIITLDSMGNTHSRTCTNLKDYLVQEIKHKRQIDVETPPRFGWTARGIPEQSDFSSCGIYLLAYVERFLKQPDQVISDIVYKKDLGWSDIDPVAMRGNIRELIIRLRQEQNVQRDKEKQAKQDAKALKLAQKKMDIPAVDSSPAHAAQTPGTTNPRKPVQEIQVSSSDPPSSGKTGNFTAANPQDGRCPSNQNLGSSPKPVRSPPQSNQALIALPRRSPKVDPLVDSSDIERLVSRHDNPLVPPILSSSSPEPGTPKRKEPHDELTLSEADPPAPRRQFRNPKKRYDGVTAFKRSSWSYMSMSGDHDERHESPEKQQTKHAERENRQAIVVVDESPQSEKTSGKRTTSPHFTLSPSVGRQSQRGLVTRNTPSRDDRGKMVVYGGTGRRAAKGDNNIDLTGADYSEYPYA
ncbi:sentrin-specific protease [Verticillium dahliae VdLs.17]|uniref:Sentrin-specific protease n=1 Tax=Verticillium dahliae (strain VdLs.17 / ATCC MYA-4575 / FGSC 10137) TaxID=498257 RepID=G2WUA3_VERDV|nr:sentrin-specific protease [Verticillium dahliae VdLs.17]EGY17694.1 sentrin-specific protease [Verticillium dahliae VdLs.17]